MLHRNELLLGPEGMKRLKGACVTVVGLGAVGSFAVEGLARAGVGHLRLVDFDEVRATNINRQLYALHSTIGKSKADLARDRVLDIHPGCSVDTMRVFVDEHTVSQVLDDSPGVVVDAIDSLSPKVTLLRAAVRAGVPLIISCMGAARRTDPQLIRVGDISETHRCPLARLIRKRLRQDGIVSGIRCIYSVEPPQGGAMEESALREEEVVSRGRPRKPLGSLGCLTGMFGLYAAREAIMALTRA